MHLERLQLCRATLVSVIYRQRVRIYWAFSVINVRCFRFSSFANERHKSRRGGHERRFRLLHKMSAMSERVSDVSRTKGAHGIGASRSGRCRKWFRTCCTECGVASAHSDRFRGPVRLLPVHRILYLERPTRKARAAAFAERASGKKGRNFRLTLIN